VAITYTQYYYPQNLFQKTRQEILVKVGLMLGGLVTVLKIDLIVILIPIQGVSKKSG
ncbi:uncharacterized protein METZ01_LOCUS143254, partial [marine metagenome]